MPRGVSIHIGLNQVDPVHYCYRAAVLAGCVRDAEAMHGLAAAAGFEAAAPLLDGAATSSAVASRIEEAGRRLVGGDILLVTFSGHGGSVVDTNRDEGDGYDETWCLHDRQLLDDELYDLWAGFAPGVRILVVSDSCNAGTVTRSLTDERRDEFEVDDDGNPRGAPRRRSPLRGGEPGQTWERQVVRSLGSGPAMAVNRANAAQYAHIQRGIKQGRTGRIGASILLLGASQDGKPSLDRASNGLFTGTLLDVWNGGAFRGTYLQFHKAIYDRICRKQEPSYYKTGQPHPDFELQRPFTI
jgi:hypothetical protein